MKKLFVATSFLFLSILGFSQDVIIRYDGSELVGKVVDITPTQVKYRGVDTNDIYEVDRSDIFMIRYEDGQEMLMNEIVGAEEALQEEVGDLQRTSGFWGSTLAPVGSYGKVSTIMRKVDAGGAYPLYIVGRVHQITGSVLMYGGGVTCMVSLGVLFGLDYDDDDTLIPGLALVGTLAGFGTWLVGTAIYYIGEGIVRLSFKMYESKRNKYVNSTTLSYGLTPNGIGFTLRF